MHQAFTTGSDIYFNQENIIPNPPKRRHLLAHELTHTIQQGVLSGKRKYSAR